MKRTPFYEKHLKIGAKMVKFAGYEMPVVYSAITSEHLQVRNGVGVFDVSHMGEFILKGPGALDLIQSVTSNDASKLKPGQAQYSCLPNDRGGIVDDLLVYHLEDGNWMLVVNASNIEKDWNWISAHNKTGVEMHNVSDKTALLAVQGPLAAKALQSLTNIPLDEIPYYHFRKGRFAGVDQVLISATGYTGAGGFELYMYNEVAPAVWDAIFEAGKEFNIQPVGLGARDTLRLEMGFCLYGNDIDDETGPIEAGLGWITKFGKEFPSKALFEQQKAQGATRKLVGFEMIDRGIPRHDYPLADASGAVIGKVTSGTQSPSLEKAIGMGYVSKEFATPGSEIYVSVRGKLLSAKVVKMPFYRPDEQA